MLNVLVTGASGFIGSYAVPILEKSFDVATVSLQRTAVGKVHFSDVDAILHLAGKAHQMKEIIPDEYFAINHRLTLELAKRAKNEGVGHFIYISTVKVFGDQSVRVFDEDSICKPTDPYGESKYLAECELSTLADGKFVVSIVRPPLVYGRNAKGNLMKLSTLIRKLPFLPFGNIKNQRSMVFLGNLTALIIRILEVKPQGVFIAGDQTPQSTSHLVETMMQQMGIRKANIAMPKAIIFIFKKLNPALFDRLFESYIIDSSKTNRKLSFHPPFEFDYGVGEMVKNQKSKRKT